MRKQWQRQLAKVLYALMIVNLLVSFIIYPVFFNALIKMDRDLIAGIKEVYETLYVYDERIMRTEDEMQWVVDNTAHPYVPAAVYEWDEIVKVARLVAREVGNSDYKVQLGVAQCVYDRLYCPTYTFGESITEIIEKPGQFTGGIYEGDMSAYPRALEAAVDVFYAGERAYDVPVYYFYSKEHVNPRAREWFETLPLVADEGHTIFRGM